MNRVVLGLYAFLVPAAVFGQTVRVSVLSTPPGATVLLDTRDGQNLGATPLDRIAVPRGRHTLIFTMDGYEDTSLPVEIRRTRETFTATLTPLATIELTSGADGSATGADVAIDGQHVGTVPYSGKVRRGRHELRITRSGFIDVSQWLELRAGETRAQTIVLQQARVAGSLLVAGDVPGAEVFVDGAPRGNSPVVVDDLDVGPHTVEIRAPNLPPFTQTVAVQGGQRVTVNPSIRPTRPPSGSLRVLSNVPEAQVVLDGDPVGGVPADAGDVEAGTHILEVMAPGYRPIQQEIQIEASQRRVVRIELERIPEAAPVATLRVVSPIPNAQVFLDGASVGNAPFQRADLAVGQHYVTVQATGYRNWQRSIVLEAGRNVELAAELQAIASLRVTSGRPGAVVSLDGEVVGHTPFESHEVVAGQHQLVLSAPGFRDHSQSITIGPGENREIQANLESVHQTLAPEELAALRRSMTPWAAGALPKGQVALDVGVGWPYFVDLRFGVGLLPFLDGGVGLRTYVNTWEFVGRAKAAVRAGALGFGAYGELGGGLGPDSRNVYFAELGPMVSLFFGEWGAFTLRLPIELYSEKCGDVPTDPSITLGVCDRDDNARLRFGGLLEVVTSSRWNLFALFEGVLSGGERDAYQDVLGTGNRDTLVYFKLGGTYKF
ncbi:MAG: PEGA domain-containing protein [Deltaproteobacteria bacterium]|nr:PEGA domain-containing protein [Deltaproteobacteria bacterium]